MRTLSRRALPAIALVLAAALGVPAPALAEESDPVTTTVTVAYPVVGTTTIYLLGASSPISATVTPVGAVGAVEFFDGGVSIGTASVDETGVAATTTDRWPGSGERSVTARFVADDPSAYASSASAAMSYRVVDTTRIVPDIELSGETAAEVEDADLEWTIANIWFSNFSVGFERTAVAGAVTVADGTPGTTLDERRAYYSRPFTFHDGQGSTDADGDTVIAFTGQARLTSGTGNQWDFTDPVIHLGANGDGYITAVFSGFYLVGIQQEYPPMRVTIATFTGAERRVDVDGRVAVDTAVNWDGQAGGVGTWANGFDASFPNEFVALLNPGINLFFAASGISTDDSKRPLPISLSYRETDVRAAPAIVSAPEPATVTAGETTDFTVVASGTPAPLLQWQRSEPGSDAWADIPGSVTASISVSATVADDGARYRVVATNSVGIAISTDARLTVAADATEPTGEEASGGETAAVVTEPAATVGDLTADTGGPSQLAITGAVAVAPLTTAAVLLVVGSILWWSRRRAHRT